MSESLQFQYPWVLALLALLPVYALLVGRTGKFSALRFPGAEIARAAGVAARAAAGRFLLFLRLPTVGLLIIALAGPRFANDRTETQVSGVDIMLVLDLSWSMMALDMGKPGDKVSRFDIASTVLEDFIRRRPNDRIGLIVFSAVPYVVSPLTLNHDWLVQGLKRLHVGIIRELGTAIGDGAAAATKRLKDAKDSKSRIIILLTDGDNNKGEIDPVPAAQLAAALGAKIYTIGIGIEAPCQLPKFNPATGKLQLDPMGNVIPTLTLQPANYTVLDKMATLAHGRSYRATNRGELQNIYDEIDQLERTEVKLRRFTTYTPLFQWPLLAALGLFGLELVLANTRLREGAMMDFAHPQFAEPRWLWLAVLGPLLLVVLHRYSAWARRRQLAQLAAPHFLADLTRSHSPARRAFKHALLVLGVAGIGLALARPQWGEQEGGGQALGEDIMFVVDCSQSMLAADVTPNRLERTKLAILDFVQRHGRGRIGLVAFAGQAFLQCPLTFDHGAFEDALIALDERTIPVAGTDIGRALDGASQGMEKIDRRKVMVLITDGEDLEKGGVRMAQALATNNVVVFTLGVGTPAGAQIQVRNDRGKPEFLRDAQGEIVRSRLDETTLRAVAQATRGNYFPLGPVGEGLARVQSALATMDGAGGSARAKRFAIDRFHVPVAVVLGLLVIESLQGTRRRHGEFKMPGPPAVGMLILHFALLIGCAWPPNSIAATNEVAKISEQPAPTKPREFFNAGTQKLGAGQWRDAETWLQTAVASQQAGLQPPALYNLGLTRFALGAEELKKSPDGKQTTARAQAASSAATAATQAATEALAGDDLQKMLEAYQRGRGARREVKAAKTAIRRALEVHGNVLTKWQRASGDFKSTVELKKDAADAQHNADVVDRHIARLVDSLREMQGAQEGLGQKSAELGEAMKALKGKIPGVGTPPGPGGEEDEEEDEPFGPQPGMQEGLGREGKEIPISPEQAGQLLDGFKLGGNARLPIGQGNEGKPKDRKGKNW